LTQLSLPVSNKLKRRSTYLFRPVFLLLLLALFVVGYQIVSTSLLNRKPEQLIPKVLAVWPHDPSSFTEGLLWYNGFLFESSGLYGKSNLRKVEPQTGSLVQRTDNPTTVFGGE
jgi:glutamine cyclotransferase